MRRVKIARKREWKLADRVRKLNAFLIGGTSEKHGRQERGGKKIKGKGQVGKGMISEGT